MTVVSALLLGPVDALARDSRCISHITPGTTQAVPSTAPDPSATASPEASRPRDTALRLAGLFTYANGEGLAIVELESKDSAVVSVGEIVVDDVCLEELLLRGAIVRRQGRYEILPLQSASGQSVSTPLPMAQDAEPADERQASAGDEGRKAMILADAAIAAPYVVDGAFAGLIIYNGQHPEVLNQVGLQSGDVIVAIGDVELTEPEEGFSRLEGLASGDLVSLMVIRDNQRIPFHFLLP